MGDRDRTRSYFHSHSFPAGGIVTLYSTPVSLSFVSMRINLIDPWAAQTVDYGNAHAFYDCDVNATDHLVNVKNGYFDFNNVRLSGKRVYIRSIAPAGTPSARLRWLYRSEISLRDSNILISGTSASFFSDASSLEISGNSNFSLVAGSSFYLNVANFSLATENEVIVSGGARFVSLSGSQIDIAGNATVRSSTLKLARPGFCLICAH
jgi:hypothetical protein